MQRIERLIGIAYGAGKVIVGNAKVEHHIKLKKEMAIILATDAGESTKRNILFLCDKYNVPVKECLTKECLAQVLKCKPTSVIGILDKHFIDGIWNGGKENGFEN